MNELDLVKLWNTKRTQIILAQFPPTLILGIFLALAASGYITKQSPLSLKLLALAIVLGTGGLSMLTQIAAVREGFATARNIKSLENPSLLASSISISATERYMSWTVVLLSTIGALNLFVVINYLFR